MKKIILPLVAIFSSIIYTGCATSPSTVKKDISAYQNHMPKSILVLPPVNNSPDVKATYGYWSTVTVPVAEAGYYVFPLSVVDSMFKENGVTNGADAQSIPPQKLQDIFGADAGLYIKIKQYGSSYQVIQSVTTVEADAKLIDLKTGEELWTGSEKVSQSSSDNNSGLIGMLVGALVQQIASSLNDRAYPIASAVNGKMLTPTPANPGKGLLYGPRSVHYQQQGAGK